jgi:hypothetical protein
MRISKTSVLVVLAGTLLVGCVVTLTDAPIPQYDGPVAPPQVAYRIDDHRYFEVVPKQNMACTRARLFYVDTARGIRTNVTSWDRILWGRLLIDAANDQYLISPIIGMDPDDCQSGDSRSTGICNSRLRYSLDAGRTWKVTVSRNIDDHEDVYLVGDTVYHAGKRARLPALASGDSAWTDFLSGGQNKMPPVVKPPIDNEPNCDKSKTIKIKE